MENKGLTSILNKKTTTGLVVLMIIYTAFRFIGPFLIPLFNANLSAHDYGEILSTRGVLEFIHTIVQFGFNIVIGVFLISQAKQVKYNKALWFSLGAVFGMIAIILFFTFRIYDNTKSNVE